LQNSAFNSTRDWSRKPKNYKKNNASMPVKTEVSEEDSANRAMDSISVLPLKVACGVLCVVVDVADFADVADVVIVIVVVVIVTVIVIVIIIITNIIIYSFDRSYFVSDTNIITIDHPTLSLKHYYYCI
jgi:hypothetical protein